MPGVLSGRTPGQFFLEVGLVCVTRPSQLNTITCIRSSLPPCVYCQLKMMEETQPVQVFLYSYYLSCFALPFKLYIYRAYTAAPPYVDIRLVDHGERLRIGDKLHVECNSSSEHIAFCVVGASCDDSLPNGTKATVSDTLEYYSNGSGRTLYRRTLELSVVAELDNISLQCKAGEGVPAYTRAVLLQGGLTYFSYNHVNNYTMIPLLNSPVEEDEISRATPTGTCNSSHNKACVVFGTCKAVLHTMYCITTLRFEVMHVS